MRISLAYLCLVILIFALVGCNNQEADRIYVNAVIWTGDSSNANASVIAIKGNKIVYVGNDSNAVTAIEKIDLKGKMMVPGFIDDHTHFLMGGYSLSSVKLKDAKSKQDFINILKQYCTEHPGNEWIGGGDWNNDAWGGEMPQKEWIDSVTGDHPLAITRYDGHVLLANTKALMLARISRSTPDPFGGTIIRSSSGEPTGVLKDEAMELVNKIIPSHSEKQLSTYLEDASNHAISNGVTQVHDVGMYGGFTELKTYRDAHKKNQLKVRVYSFVPLQKWKQMADYVRENGKGDDFLKWGGVKGFVDGSLGAITAWFYEPYLDQPNSKGFNITDTTDIIHWVKSADSVGLQVVVHAIGDHAIDFILNVFENTIKENGASNRRFRIEHTQHFSEASIPRFKKLNVSASMQPYHLYDDGSFAPKRLDSARLSRTYAFKTLLNAGANVCFGSDWTVAPLDPILGIHAAVTRQTSDGKNPAGWYPEQKLTVEEALKCYTDNNAYGVNQENLLGKLKVGFLADFAVIDKNLLAIPSNEIKNAKVVMTVINGNEVYKK